MTLQAVTTIKPLAELAANPAQGEMTMNKIKIADSPDGKPNYIIKQRKLGSRGGKGKNVIITEVEAGANSCIRSVEQFLIDNKLMPFGGFVQFNR